MADNDDDIELKKKKKSKKRKNKETDIEVAETVQISEIVVEKSIEKKKKKKKKSEVEKTITAHSALNEQATRVLETLNNDSNAAVKTKKKKAKVNSQDHYLIHEDTNARSISSIEEYRTQFEIRVYPEEEALIYKPLLTFNELEPSLHGRCDYVLDYLKEKNFTKPSPIQVLLINLFFRIWYFIFQ